MDASRRFSGVCRSLFGPVDHDQLSRDLKQKMREISEQDTRCWNFNFQTDTPLPGRYQWEEMPSRCAAALYRESEELVEEEEEDGVPVGSEDADAQSGSRRDPETNQENCPSISNTLKFLSEVIPVRRKRTLSKPPGKPQHSAQITDFFVKRRRTSSETKNIQNPLSVSEPVLCKRIR